MYKFSGLSTVFYFFMTSLESIIHLNKFKEKKQSKNEKKSKVNIDKKAKSLILLQQQNNKEELEYSAKINPSIILNGEAKFKDIKKYNYQHLC